MNRLLLCALAFTVAGGTCVRAADDQANAEDTFYAGLMKRCVEQGRLSEEQLKLPDAELKQILRSCGTVEPPPRGSAPPAADVKPVPFPIGDIAPT